MKEDNQEKKFELLEKEEQGNEFEENIKLELIKEMPEENNEEKDEPPKDKDENEEEEDDEDELEKDDKKQKNIKKSIFEEEKEEKKRLVEIIDRLKEDLDSEEYETLNQIYEQYLNNEDITKRNIKPGTSRKALYIMYYIIAPVFSIINLIGVFQSISIMKVIFQILKNALYNYYISWTSSDVEPFSINKYMEQYDFYKMLNNDTKKESFDFNLMMFMAFLGDILLKSRGFRISTSIFGGINIISMFLISNFSFDDYDRKNNTYSIFQILFLLLCWVLLFTGVGASALLSQQIIIDSNYKYDTYLKKLNEKSKIEWEKKKEEWRKMRQEKEKQKDKEKKDDQQYQDELKEIKDINEDKKENNDSKNENIENDIKNNENDNKNNENDIKNDENDNKNNENNIKNDENDIKRNDSGEIKTVKSEQLIEFKYNKNHKIQKQNSQEINIKEIAKDFKIIGKVDQKYKKSKTLMPKDILADNKKLKKATKKPIKKENQKGKDNKNKFDSFFMICITTIIGYFLKYLLNIFLVKEIEKYQSRDMPDLRNIINEGSEDIKCGLDYNCFEIFFNDSNLTNSKNQLFNELIYRVKINDEFEFYSLLIIYSSSVILSIILYSIFVCIFTKNKKKKNVNGDVYRVCEICGYSIYSEDIILNINPPCCECCKLLCGTCHNCINMMLGSLFCCIDDEEKEDFNCCYCCCENNYNEYKKNKEFFCYCYQAKRKQNWFNKFITSDIQKKIFPYMLEYFLLQFLTIAFEKQFYEMPIEDFKPSYKNETDYYKNYDEIESQSSLDEEDLFSFIVFIVTFFLFFYFTLSFNRFAIIFSGNTGINENTLINQLSNGILDGAHAILIFDGIYSLVLSALYLAQNEHDIFQSHYFIFAPILMNKFFYFTLIYYCVSFSEEKKKFDLISGSTLISIYLVIWDLIVSFIRDISSLKGLYITQIVFSCFPCFVLFLVISVVFYCVILSSESDCGFRLSCLFCFFSFLLCFGGFWMRENNLEDIYDCECSECSCDIDCYCCFDCLDYCSCLDCISSLCCCECCDCCDCYDCFGCCSCFYCCRDSCECYC